jgi:hypothetical protein
MTELYVCNSPRVDLGADAGPEGEQQWLGSCQLHKRPYHGSNGHQKQQRQEQIRRARTFTIAATDLNGLAREHTFLWSTKHPVNGSVPLSKIPARPMELMHSTKPLGFC